MFASLTTHTFAIASGVVIVIGVLLMVQGTTDIQRMRIPKDPDDQEGFTLADHLLKRARVFLRAGEVTTAVGAIGGITAMLMYGGIIPGL